jgi:hypothetical protein
LVLKSKGKKETGDIRLDITRPSIPAQVGRSGCFPAEPYPPAWLIQVWLTIHGFATNRTGETTDDQYELNFGAADG